MVETQQKQSRRAGKNTWKNCIEKGPNEPDYYNGVVSHPEADILESEAKWALGNTVVNKASGCDGIPVELFRILKDDTIMVLLSICQQIWKTQQQPQDWKRSILVPIPKKGSTKECTNHRTIALISHSSKVMLKNLACQASALCETNASRCPS